MSDELRRLAEATSPSPWELIPGDEWHGPYVANAFGGDVCDCYAMSNPNALSRRNGGDSTPVMFSGAEANAAWIAAANPAAVLALLDRLAAAERVVEAADKAHKLRTGARDRVMAFGLGASNLPPPVHAITDHLIAENELVETLGAYRAATEPQP